jgi:prepilin-type N-terminal cleavage/methylation domain-containing protein
MNDRGFSLFELLVVIAILAVLAAMSVPRFADFRAAAYDARSQQDLRHLASAQELHRAIHGQYAASAADVASFDASEGVRLEISHADDTRYAASADHPSGGRRYIWDIERSPPMSSVVLDTGND